MRKSLITLKIFTLSLGIMVLNRFSVVEQISRKMFWTNVLISGQGQEASTCGYGKAHTQWQRRHAEWCLVKKICSLYVQYKVSTVTYSDSLLITAIYETSATRCQVWHEEEWEFAIYRWCANTGLSWFSFEWAKVSSGEATNFDYVAKVSEFQWLGLSSSAHLWRLLSGTRVEALAKRC